MATSGRVNSGVANFTYFYFQWQLASQNIGGNYSTINWQWGVSKSGGSTATWYSNAIKSVSGYVNGGQVIGGNTWSNITVGGDVQLLNGSYNVYHNGDGTKNFGISSTGWLYGYGNYSNSGSWDLPTIPRHASLTALSMDSGGVAATDEGPMWLEFTNPAGTAVDAWIEAAPGNRIYTSASGIGSRYNFDFTGTLPTLLQQASPNSNTGTLRIGIHDSLGGDSWDYRDRSYTIANDSGQANPTFSTFTFADANSTTSTITGNNQVLIQGQSDLQVTVSSGNKATPNKNATMDHYTINIGGYSQNLAYSTSTVMKDVGAVSDVTGTRTISVTAVDSRGNSKLATASVNILPYAAPVVTSTAGRANGYDDALILTVAGNISPLTLSGTDKNSIHSATTASANKAEYRVATDGGSYGAWTDLATTQTATTGAINGNSTVIIAAAGSASSTHSFSIQVKITDKLGSTTQTIAVPVGTSIFRIGTDRKLYYNESELQPTAVNSTTSASSITPVLDYGQYNVTALAANLTINAITGTPSNGRKMLFCIRDAGTSKTLTWDSSYVGIGVSLPTATVANKWIYVGATYNATAGAWHVIGVNMQA